MHVVLQFPILFRQKLNSKRWISCCTSNLIPHTPMRCSSRCSLNYSLLCSALLNSSISGASLGILSLNFVNGFKILGVTMQDTRLKNLKGFTISINPLGASSDAPWCPEFTKFHKTFFFKNCQFFHSQIVFYITKTTKVRQLHIQAIFEEKLCPNGAPGK